MSIHAIKLIVGLGNPGAEYANTRHNVGAWFVQNVAEHYAVDLRMDAKFKGFYGVIKVECGSESKECKLLAPTTYMNCSGESVLACSNFYKIPSDAILVVHDELDLLPGVMKIKCDGSDNGHNGIKSIIKCLGTKNFYRLRVGIGRPQNKNYADYVLNSPGKVDAESIKNAINKAISVIPQMLSGDIPKATQILHTDKFINDVL